MIQNFNFYDVYGYLLPGLAFLGLLWVPIGLATGRLPATEWTSAVVGIALAYITGHVLQNFARVIPSSVKSKDGTILFPSEVLLDVDDKTFTSEFKRRLAEQIETCFGIDVKSDPTETGDGEETVAIFGVEIEDGEIAVTKVATFSDASSDASSLPAKDSGSILDPLTKRRQDAFFLCRAALINDKSAAYAEQSEGMYTLMRGLAAATFSGSAYYLGWASGGLMPKGFERLSWLPVTAGLGLAVAASLIALLHPKSNAWWAVSFLLLGIFGLGNWLASPITMTWHQRGTYLLLAGASVLISLRCLAAYKAFAVEFPKAVYRGFYDQRKSKDTPKS